MGEGFSQLVQDHDFNYTKKNSDFRHFSCYIVRQGLKKISASPLGKQLSQIVKSKTTSCSS